MIVLDCAWNMLSKKKPIWETFESEIAYNTLALTLSFVSIIITISAIIVAFKCNPDNKLFYGIVALLFSAIYLLQYGFRKYILNQPGYC